MCHCQRRCAELARTGLPSGRSIGEEASTRLVHFEEHRFRQDLVFVGEPDSLFDESRKYRVIDTSELDIKVDELIWSASALALSMTTDQTEE